MPPRKIIIDTDPGQDDAVAILLALASPEDIDVLGITAVAGNVPLALTAKNARIVCELAGRTEVPVFAGCDRPMGRALVTAEHVHGETGLDGPVLPDPVMPLQDQHAVDFIIDTLRADAIGHSHAVPARAADQYRDCLSKSPRYHRPRARDHTDGWGLFRRSATSPQRRNSTFMSIPQAADIVFKSGATITVMPLDVTHKALVTRARNDAFPRPWHAGRHRRRADDRFL